MSTFAVIATMVAVAVIINHILTQRHREAERQANADIIAPEDHTAQGGRRG